MIIHIKYTRRRLNDFNVYAQAADGRIRGHRRRRGTEPSPRAARIALAQRLATMRLEFSAAFQQNIGFFHSSSLKMVPKTQTLASGDRLGIAPPRRSG